jgi:import inner membrane translocase subunit TIM50
MKYPENIPTLVMDLDKVVLFMEHDHRHGWRVTKRPFADQFFRELSLYYELVIFSDDVFPVALEIADMWKLPVNGVLHRDFCKKKRNHYVKDLSKLGRNLEKVILLDHDPAAFQLQPENGIHIKPFEGDPNDSELDDLMAFLKSAAQSNMDIRQYIQKFGGGDMDLGRRYLLHKKDQDKMVEQRRSLGRAFAQRSGGFPSAPPQAGFGAFPR